jgi:beta-barrel assembly-enhancing protease
MARAYQRYDAHAFHADRGPEALEGTIFFTTRSLTFQSGETLAEVPLSRLEAEFDETGEGRVILRDSGDSGWTFATADTSVLECRSVPQIAELAQQFETQATRGELSRRVKMVLIFFGGAVLVLWLGMIAVGAMVRSTVAKVPASVEQEVGNCVLSDLKEEMDLVENTNVVAELTALAEPLLSALPTKLQWQLYVVDEEVPNAFALPGGHILVTRGLLDLAQTPEELLGVLAHEVAHVTEKHGFRQQVAAAGPLLVLQVFVSGQSGTTALLGGASALLVAQSFSQEYENEADDTGWDYMVKANIDPRGMITMFRKLQDYELKHEEPSLLPKAFASHPDVAKRIARLEKKWKRLSRKSGFLDLSDKPVPEP